MANQTLSEGALIRYRMNHIKSAYAVSARRPRKVVKIKAGDCRSHRPAIAIGYRMVKQRDKQERHLR